MSVAKTAARLGMHRSTLYRILKKNPRLRGRNGKIDAAALRKYTSSPNKIGRPYGRRVIWRNKRETDSEWEGRIWLERMTAEKRRHALRRWAEDCGFQGQMEKVTRLANDMLNGAEKGAEARKKYPDEDLPLDFYPSPKGYRDLKMIIRLERRTGEPIVAVSKIGSL
jgi:hypothetical protein